MAKRKGRTRYAETKLTAKESKFLAEYMRCGNGTQAALRAGYAPRSAHSTATHILQKSKVKKLLAENAAELRKATKVTREQLIKSLLEIVNTPCKKAPTPAEKARAIEVIAKMHGFMVDKHEVKAATEDIVRIYIPHNGRDSIPSERLCEDPRLPDGRMPPMEDGEDV